jgi:hypothetical protein
LDVIEFDGTTRHGYFSQAAKAERAEARLVLRRLQALMRQISKARRH